MVACPASKSYLAKLDKALRRFKYLSSTGKANRAKFVKEACDKLIARK